MRENLPRTKYWASKVLNFLKNFPLRERLVGQKGLFKLRLSALHFLLALSLSTQGLQISPELISPLGTSLQPLSQTQVEGKSNKEILGFAPFWTFDKLDNIDFDTLTTLAYFGVPLLSDGSLDRSDQGYQTFKSRKATSLFKKAHINGTRVVLTITQMSNGPILALLGSDEAQQRAIEEIVGEVEKRGIDGVNVDLEYSGNPEEWYRERFTTFVANLTEEMHQKNPNSKVTVSVYAASMKDQKLYDIAGLSRSSDGIFMMAYDFAVAGSDNAIPTAPLYGHKEGKYWYDISTAVDDFLKVMPADKLILGVPWYGYNYLVYEPVVKAETRPYYSWQGKPAAQTYSIAEDNIKPEMEGILDFKTGWDEHGQVGWKAYYVAATDTWRMLFLDDPKSLGLKYDFAKDKNLAGVGIWALGFDEGRGEMWSTLKGKFGTKKADHSLVSRPLTSEEETPDEM